MRLSLLTYLLTAFFFVSQGWADTADLIKGRKIYEVHYIEQAPVGVRQWLGSEMVKTGKYKEDRFAPYNSKSASGLILDATTTREINADPKIAGRETSFYMLYDEAGWHVFIQCIEPEAQQFVDEGKEVSLELFFVPGIEDAYYYQMIVAQPSGKTHFYDWAMPHKDYRSLKEFARVESQASSEGFATYIFVPWEAVYDRMPLSGDYWRFSFMRWNPAVSWGGRVHETGSFGLVKFLEPPAQVKKDIQKRMLRSAWFEFLRKSREAARVWNDDVMGDVEFYTSTIKPLIDSYTAIGGKLGEPRSWDADKAQKYLKHMKDWMEFDYIVSERRAAYLMAKHFQ